MRYTGKRRLPTNKREIMAERGESGEGALAPCSLFFPMTRASEIDGL